MPAPHSPQSAFATVLRRQRESAGLTQAELAERAGIGVRTVSNLERGINTSPYPSTVRLLADALGLPSEAHGDLLAAAGRRQVDDRARPVTIGGFLGATPLHRLVGREAECAAIIAALTASAAGAGTVVLLAGEPGIGKTRLAQEARVYAQERGFVVASGRCFEEQGETPFVPLVEAFASLVRDAPTSLGDGIAERWPSLAPLVPERFPPGEAAADPSSDAQMIHRAAAALVRELAEHRPVAILLDDLHWADAATTALLTHLVRHTAADRVLLLGTYRDAEVGPGHPVRTLAASLTRERLTRPIDVARLDLDGTARLLTERLGETHVPTELSDLVHRHSDGNPFFSGEILAALIDRGDLARLDGAWVCRELPGIEAPASVTELIGERVSHVSATARDVLEAASALGAVFDPHDLPMSDVDDDELERALDEAVGARLLTIVDGGYAFDHSLTQQSLYAGLSPVRRRRLHRTAGERLERRTPADRRRRSAEIARHLLAGGLPDRAVPFLLGAGDLAAGVHAADEALRLYGHAVDVAAEVGDDASVASGLEGLGHVELRTARYEEAVDHLVRAARAYRRTGDVASRLRVEGLLAEAQHRRGEGEAAAVRLDEVVAELEVSLEEDGHAVGGAALGTGLARVRLSLGQHGLCVDAAERAARLARREDAVAAEADAHGVAATALLFLDRPGDALDAFERAISLAVQADALTVESGATLGLQWAVTMHGSLDRAESLGERGLDITRRAGNADMESLHAANLGLSLFYRGDWARAEAHLEHSIALARSGSPTLFSGIPPVYLGVLRAGQGDAAAATACYDEAATAPDLQTFAFTGYLEARRAELELRDGAPAAALARLEPWLADESPTRIHDVMLLTAAAEACLALGDTDRGLALVDRALRRADATRNAIDGLDARRVRGRCLLAQGRAGEARTCWDEALTLAIDLPHPAAEARIRCAIALDGGAGGTRRHLTAALDLFTRLGATWDVALVEQMLHGD